jgi:DNA repair photolyase
MNNRIRIRTDKGEMVESHAPVIISASRSTDIPAFYAQWFINRLKAGYVIWYNPFNRKPMYVSFQNTKVVVFWTKNPKPLIPFLKELDDKCIHYYFQFTLNDYEQERFEPNLPPLDERIETFKTLSDRIGKEKIIWRFDPLIVTPQIMPRDLLKKIWNIGNRLKGYTDKLVFSFIDIKTYRKVQNNLVKESSLFSRANIEDAEFTGEQITEIAEGLAKIREHWKSEGWNISLATCAEQIDLNKYGIEHNSCIDSELMKRIFPGDNNLSYYLSYGKSPAGKDPLFVSDILSKQFNPKDKGQRKNCKCMISKDIGMYNTCKHFCVYCYANASKKTVEKNLSLHKNDDESISPISKNIQAFVL